MVSISRQLIKQRHQRTLTIGNYSTAGWIIVITAFLLKALIPMQVVQLPLIVDPTGNGELTTRVSWATPMWPVRRQITDAFVKKARRTLEERISASDRTRV